MAKTNKRKSKHKRKTKRIYKKKDYNSNDGMLTTVWGPSAWHYIHTVSFNYPVHPTCDDKRHYRNFILNLRHILPCGKCRKNLCKNFKKHPLMWRHMRNRESFSKYVYTLHETINKLLGKKSGLSYADVRDRYEHFRSRCTLKNRNKIAEKGCTEPVFGEKSKCVLKIVPQNKACDTFQMDEKCVKQK
tara:strand:+ start:1234 stop:1797 length:564 start_codon:yes stop_codon:yes gene_type:complete